jgi:localization factor PodJL
MASAFVNALFTMFAELSAHAGTGARFPHFAPGRRGGAKPRGIVRHPVQGVPPMKSGPTWNVTDLDDEARDAAIAAARRAGMSVNDWLNQAVARRIIEEAPARGRAGEADDEALLAATESVAALTRRIRAMDSGARTGIAGLKGRLSEIEENLGRAGELPGDRRTRSLRGVTALVDRLNRDIDNADESARSQVEGMRSRASSHGRSGDFGDARPVPPPRLRNPPPADATLDELRERLDLLLARGADVSRPVAGPPPRLDDSLRSLEDRLEQARSRLYASTAIPEPPPAVPPVVPAASSLVSDELSEAIAEIARRQRALDERADAGSLRREQKMIADSIATLRTDVAGLVARLSTMGRDTAEDKEAWFNLARRIEALAAESPVDRAMLAGIRQEIEALRAISETGARETTVAERLDDIACRVPDRGRIDALGEEVSALRRAVETGDSPKAIGRLEMRVSELGRSLEAALNTRQAMVDTSAAGLGAGLADLRAAVEELSAGSQGLARQTAVSDISASLEEIRYALDGLGHASRERDADAVHAAIEHVAGRLDEIRAAIDAQEATVRAASEDHAARLEARFDELAVRIDAIMDRAASADIVNGLHDRLEALVERLDGVIARPREEAALVHLAEEIAAVRADIAAVHAAPRTDFIENQLHDLADRIDHLSRHAPSMASLEALHGEIAAMRGDLAGFRSSEVDRLEAEIGDLGARLTDCAAWVPEPAAFEQVKAEVADLRSEVAGQAPAASRLEAEVRALAARIDAATRPGADPDHIAGLEAQVARLAEELDQVMPHGVALQQIETNLDRLRGHLAESRTEAVEAARRAARDEVSEFAGRGIDVGLIESLRHDLDHVRAAVGETDRKSGESVQSIQGTLAGIVNRLAQLESETERAATAAPAEPLAAVGPAVAPEPEARPSVLRAFPPRRAEPAAAENEPATDKPDLAALRELAANTPEASPERAAASRRADFIAAARRAAQAAVAEASATPAAAEQPERNEPGEARPGAFARIGQAIRTRRRPLLLAAAAIVLAIGSLYVYGPEFGASPGQPQTAKTETPAAVEPVASAADPAASATKAAMADPSAAPAKAAPEPGAPSSASAAIAMAPEPLTSAFTAAPPAPAPASFSKAAPASPAAIPAAAAPAHAIQASADASPIEAARAVTEATDSVIATGSIGSDKLRAAAAAGDPAAAFEVATRYAEGRGVPASLTTAAEWYGRAAVSAWKAKPSLAEANVVNAPAGGWDGDDEGVTAADQQALVRKIQALLTGQGYDVGTPDGVAGPKTRDAVKAYQRSIGAAETGQIDQKLVASLSDR